MTKKDKKNFLHCKYAILVGNETMKDVQNFNTMKFSKIKDVCIFTPLNQKQCSLYVKFAKTKSFVFYKKFKLKTKSRQGDHKNKIEYLLKSLAHYPINIKHPKRFFKEIGVDFAFDAGDIEIIENSSLVTNGTPLGKNVTVLSRLIQEFKVTNFSKKVKIEYLLNELKVYPEKIENASIFFKKIGIEYVFDSADITIFKKSSLVQNISALNDDTSCWYRLVNELKVTQLGSVVTDERKYKFHMPLNINKYNATIKLCNFDKN
eukprot:83766_1